MPLRRGQDRTVLQHFGYTIVAVPVPESVFLLSHANHRNRSFSQIARISFPESPKMQILLPDTDLEKVKHDKTHETDKPEKSFSAAPTVPQTPAKLRKATVARKAPLETRFWCRQNLPVSRGVQGDAV